MSTCPKLVPISRVRKTNALYIYKYIYIYIQRERERESETETERQRQRKTDRQTDSDRQTGRERERERETDRQTDRQTDRWITEILKQHAVNIYRTRLISSMTSPLSIIGRRITELPAVSKAYKAINYFYLPLA